MGMMQYDVKSAHTTGSALLVSFRCRVKGFLMLGSSTAGDIVLYDSNTASSTGAVELIRFAVPGNANNVVSFDVPGEGILALNGVYATTPTGASITIIYG
jgi:hypothetical protein